MADLTEVEAQTIAKALDKHGDAFSKANRRSKILVLKYYLDEQIGSEPHAEIKSIPGVPSLSGAVLESISDIMLEAIATLVVDKLFPASP